MEFTTARRMRAAIALAGFVSVLLRAGEPPASVVPPAPTEIVRLPMFFVEAGKERIKWKYTTLPGIEVLSSCSRRQTEDFVESFSMLYAAFHLLVPEELSFQSTTPQSVILLEEGDESITREVAKQAVQAERARVARSTMPTAAEITGTNESRGNAFIGHELRFFPNLRLSDTDSYMTFMLLRSSSFDPGGLTLTAEEIGSLLERRTPPLPRWYINGVLVLYQSAVLRWGGIMFPTVNLHVNATDLAKGPEATGAELMQIFLTSAADAADPQLQQVQARKAALFIRWAMGSPRTRDGLRRFVSRACQERPTPKMFSECFGQDLTSVSLAEFSARAANRPQMLKTLPPTKGPNWNWPRPQEPDIAGASPKPQTRDAKPAEVARILGDWQRRASSYVRPRDSAIADRYLEQAKRMLTHAYEGGNRDPDLLAVLGLAYCDGGDREQARPFLEAAVNMDCTRPRAYVELAAIYYGSDLSQPADGSGHFSTAQVGTITRLLREARRYAPPLSDGYVLLARTLRRSAEKLSEADAEALVEATRLFPGDVRLLEAISALYKAGQLPSAQP